VLLTIALLLLGSCGGSTEREYTVELNGDSIVAGLGLEVKPSMYLQKLLPDWSIQDKSQVGLTLDSLVKGYSTPWVNGPVPTLGVQPPFAEITRTADIVVISLGGNDAYGNADAREFEENLRTVISAIKQEKRIPMLTGIVQLNASTNGFTQEVVNKAIEFNTITQKVAIDMNVINVNWDTVEYKGLGDTIDGIHRTQSASDRLVQRLALGLKSIRSN